MRLPGALFFQGFVQKNEHMKPSDLIITPSIFLL
jgi:hypothetical protein